ncbi:MAG: radical SAM family heme chaperone HemW [Desulfobacterales bacterium]|nr:radical SAM family heme chaperone HemW [Pseudomonadota bacterium]MBU4357312.1 radical SAM family heme chaperone HemW [Pseudomonadota bacterium]MCG2771405.1 radical SAM family heme chaperone HemW [Desulfobacterales bacterium]
MSCANYPGLYVHIPFCRSKCPYCDFYSVTATDQIEAFLSALDTEARLYRDQFPAFDSLFLGGGTPSLLDAGQLGALVASLRRHFVFAPDSEITIEANPDDITAEKLRLFRDLGINRLSLGVQSFDEAELRFLGRRHTARQTAAAIDLIRAAGFTNLGIDLMYGLPGQTLDAWVKTLETALSCAPEHLSCYQLTIMAGETPAPHETPALRTPLARRVARGEISLPDEETQREFFLLTANFLTARGYLHYEVANFAREEHYVCRHNLKYWTRTPYLGLGPAAHSFKAGRRWWNISSVAQYCSSLSAGKAPVAEAESLTPEQVRLETLALGFRTHEGVSLATIRERPGGDAMVEALTRAGLVRVDGERVMATLDGLVVADRLPLGFAD